ncbi:MAG: hypothetical protein E6K03_10485 [Methanobacteriota archaeon]|nr:MAG: hypothetical protein E6K03_10485 [Euryarchaeota archaeon]
MVDDSNLDVAIHHVERVLADQLNSVNSLSNKASVALGFVVTVFGGRVAVLILLGDEVRRPTESG